MSTCELCGRDVSKTTQHHLTPKAHGGRQIVELCSACHRQIHALFTNDTLAEELNSLEALRKAPEIQRFLKWIRKQQDRRFKVHAANRRR